MDAGLPVIDSHVHLVDFLQHGLPPQDFVHGLDQAGVDGAVIFGMAVKKKWAVHEPREPSYYLDDNAPCSYYSLTDQHVADFVLELAEDQRRWLAPLVCGFDPTDLLAVQDLERIWHKYPFWRGVGELLLRHDDLTNLTHGEPGRINHPALDPVLDFCREHDCPVSVHQDSSSPGRPQEREYVVEMEEALNRHPHTTVVWCHAGADRRLNPHGYADLAGEMLRQYPNLIFDLSWVLLDKAICPDNRPVSEWLSLIGRHPDRFVLGSDITGRLDGLPGRTEQFTALLEALDPTARDQLAHRNAQRLWFADTS